MKPDTLKRLERLFEEIDTAEIRVERKRSGWWMVIGVPRATYISEKGRSLNAAMRRFLKKAGY